MIINLPCNQTCVTQPFRIPHIKTSSEYRVGTIPYNPYPFTTATGNEAPASVYADDQYSPIAAIPFSVCFYDSLFTQFVYGSNGLITFDIANADCANAWPITTTIFSAAGTICAAATQYYPKASIMGAYSDLDPRFVASPGDRKIEWRIDGTAPFRRLIVSYYHVGVWGNTCGINTPNTFQIVVYESSGIIEEYIEQKACVAGTSNGRAILGVQNWNRDKAEAAPGKNNTVWNEDNTAYRFMPSGPISRFVSCELLTLGGTLITAGDTVTTTAGLLDVTFPSFCPTAATAQYVIKSVFAGCDIPGNQIITLDTVTINRTTNLNATAAVTPTSCGVSGTGTATITVPAGVGAPPYTYVLNPIGTTQTTNQFTGLVAGNYTVIVTDAGGVCSSTLPITIVSTGTLAVTYNVTNTTCVGANNGSIVVNPPNGTPPILYSINGGPFTANNVFSNLAPGTYFISTQDNAGCVKNFDPVPVNSGPALTLTSTSTPSSCPGANNGSITITAINGGGTPPYQYSINGGPYQASNTFNNLLGSTSPYFISVIDATGCTITFAPVLVDVGTGTVTGTATSTAPSCTGATNGSITVTPTSGSGPYQYSLNGGPYQASNIFGGLAPGNYTVTIREAGLCISAPIPVTVAAGAALLATATPAATSCNGATDGTITVTPGNGSAPYQYSLDGGAAQASNIFTGVSAGTHNVVVTDGAGCISAPIPVTITAGPTLTGTVSFTATSCPGVNNGTITATPTNGSGPYQYSLDGGAPQATNTFAGISAGPHTVTIRNAAGCISQPIPVNVTAGAGLTATVTPAATSCTGVNNGTIVVTPTNGTGPFTFVLDGTITQTGAASTTFTGVASGPHTVTISDAIGCVTTAPLPTTVATGTGFTAAFTTTNTSCAGAANGTITVTPGAGGTGPYTFVLDGTTTQTGAANTTFNNVASGPHTILITDANGCQFTVNNATVNPGASLAATITPAATSCSGVNNGTITITPTNGTGPYTFILDGTITQTGAVSTTFIGVAAGPHTITINNAIGCITTAPLPTTVATGTGFTAAFTTTNTSCAGAANGTITVTPGAGGTGPYTFVLDGATTQTGAANTTFNNVASGPHTILVTDANGCQFTVNNVTVNPGAPLAATTTPTATSCPGVNNGSIVVTPTNGNGPYTFVLDGTVTQTGAVSTTFAGLPAGIHTILVTDVNGCSSTLPAVNVGAGSSLTANVASTSTSCIGAVNGSITVTPTSGSGPYTFVLNGTTTQTGATTTFINLAAGGAYSVVVTDAIGCTGTFNNINVPQGSALTANALPVATSCNGATNGQITVTPNNGAGPYTFVLNGTTTQTGATNTVFTNLAANTYNVVVNDAAGCISQPIAVTVAAGPAINITLAKTDATCFGSATGSISATPSANASAPIQYSLDNVNWQASPNFTGLAANTYTVYINDAAGCNNSANITIGQPAQLQATTSAQSALCNGSNNGLIIVNATGGAAGYSYSLDNVIYQPGNTFNVAAGTYTVYVRDANNCIAQVNNVTITQPAVLTATATTSNSTCNGGNDGTITITPAGGTSTYEYSIDGVSFQSSNVLNAGPGTYTVTVRDINGCTIQVPGIVVGLTNNLTLTPSADPAPICEGNSVQLQVVSNAVQFAWTPAVKLSNAGIANPVANPATTTLYTVTATLGNCSATDDILVTVIPAPIPDAGPDGDICYGQSYQLQGSGGATYDWKPSTYLSSQSVSNPQVVPDKTIVYTLGVTDANGCASLVTDEVTVNVTPPIKVTVSPVDTIVYAGAQIPLIAASAGTSYTWSPAAGLDNPNIANPTAVAPLIDGSVVVYQVTASTSAGCQGQGTVRVQVYKGPDIYVVTAFTPNGDGRNETFIPIPVGIKKLNYFRVFNRWGQMLFSTATLNRGWDGRYGGIEQPSGAYVWMVEGVTQDNKIITKKGTVMIIR